MKLSPWRTYAKKRLREVDRIENEIARCRLEGLSAKEMLTALKTARLEKCAVLKLSKRCGRAKGGGQSSKAKGRSAVQQVRTLLQKTFDLKDDDLLVKATSMGGCDLHMSPAAQKLFPFAIEVKNAESLSIWSALAQATVNAKKKNAPPVVFFKRAHSPMYVAFVAEDLLNWLS